MASFDISVIVPTRNRRDLLAGLLTSLATQTLAADRWELIVVDDGSTGSIQVDATGGFRVRVGLSKKPAINTIMLWLRAGQTGTAFPATQICVRVE